MTAFLCVVFLVLFVIWALPIGLPLEKRKFNNGVCPECGAKLSHFANDSQGGRGYICDVCGYCTWVSHKSVDENFR